MPVSAAIKAAAITVRGFGLGHGASALLRARATFEFSAGEAAGKSAPQLWQRCAAVSLIASQRLHIFRFRDEPHSWQNLAPSGFSLSQERHFTADMDYLAPRL
jgi:hypothetical protein